MADAVDEYEAAQANPQPEARPSVYQDEVPTEPATSPRSLEDRIPSYVEELQLPSLESGPRE